MQGDFFTQPPLPRFRFETTTGQWRKEKTASTGQAYSARPSAATPGVMLASDMPESSFDYFLRKSYATEKGHTNAAGEKSRMATLKHISDFERQQQQWLGEADAVLPGSFTRPASRRQQHQPLHQQTQQAQASAASSESRAALLSRKDVQGSLRGTSPHPIFGLLISVPLHAVASALSQVVGGPLLQAPDCAAATTRGLGASPAGSTETLSQAHHFQGLMRALPVDYAGFRAFLSLVAPSLSLSEGYVRDSVFHTLPCYNTVTDTVSAPELLAFVAENTFHPALDRNMTALMHAFDVERRGAILTANLTAGNAREWAEKNSFGHLRMEWLRLAAALEREGVQAESDLHVTTTASGGATSTVPPVPVVYATRTPKWLTREMLLILLCSSARLFDVANSVDLEGSTLRNRTC